MVTISNRNIIIPSNLKNIATQNDENSEFITFRIPRFIKNTDISTKVIWIKAINEGGRVDERLNITQVEEQFIFCDWILKPPATSFEGELSIQIVILSDNYKWESDQGVFNIIDSLDSNPIIPITPNFIEVALEEITKLTLRAEKGADNARVSETNAKVSETNSKISADNAKVSETNSKSSEISSANSLTDINTGLVSKLPISQANSLIKDITLDENTGIFTFRRYDNSTFIIDTALEKTIANFEYDKETKELVLILENDRQLRIPMSSFINIYTGETTATVQTLVVSGNKIQANIIGDSITMNLLNISLQNTINGKVTANEPNNASQIKFSDGQSFQDKLDNGSLKGDDGVSIATNSFFRMYVDQITGDLVVVVADGAEKPPFTLEENGDLYYTI